MRYLPNTPKDRQEMLKVIGKPSVDALFADIPEKIKLKKEIPLPPALSEPELLAEMEAAAHSLSSSSSFLGAGVYHHFIPSVVKHIVSRSEFYTAYTPYQAEMSQGALQAIYEYQTMIARITGMDAANASMYDGATAVAEAAFLACRVTGRKEIVVSDSLHPEHIKVLKTYAKGAALVVSEKETNNPACFIIQQPDFFGRIQDVSALAAKVHAKGALFIVSADPISLGILKAPGDYGADIVVGEGLSLGNPPSFGGPGLGIFAVKDKYIRQIPGRVVGRTVDADGKPGFCLTLQTREQHIRRERATSNICSNEALAALAAVVYLSVMGKAGLKKVGELCLQKTNYLKEKLRSRLVFPKAYNFKDLAVKTEIPVGLDLSRFYPEMKGARLISITELTAKEKMDELAALL